MSISPHSLPPVAVVPEIVQIVLTQATKFRAAGRIGPGQYQAQIDRLCAEELQPRGWSLSTRELADGATQYLILSPTGPIDLIDCAPTGRRAGIS